MHGEHALPGEDVVHDGEHGLLDLPGVRRPTDDDLPAPQVQHDEGFGVGAVLLRNRLEAGGVEDGVLRDVAHELLGVMLLDEHVPGKEVGPGVLVHHPDGDPVLWIRPGVAVLDEEVPALEIGRQTRPENLVGLGVEGMVHLAPGHLVPGGGLLHDVPILGGSPRVLTRPHHQGPKVGHQSLVPLHGVLVEGRGGEVPPDGVGVPDAVG
jgi:hypothetical protein